MKDSKKKKKTTTTTTNNNNKKKQKGSWVSFVKLPEIFAVAMFL